MSPLRICLVDMNNGVENQGIRCFRGIIAQFAERVAAANPDLPVELTHVQPRNLGEVPPEEGDLYLSSGGPGSPFDGYDEPWCTGFRKFVDGLVRESTGNGHAARRAMFVVCHSYELMVQHLGVARMEPRPARKFGVMPVYMTEAGMASPLLAAFGDRLFAFEHRSWQAVGLDDARLAELRGELWARESRDGVTKGEGLLSFRFAPNIEGTLFHPEADRAGALAWIARPDQAQAVIATYGELTYVRMLKTLDDPTRLARTYALLIPGWLSRWFNALAPERGWSPVTPPRYDESTREAFGRAPGHATEPTGLVEVSREGV
jgi:GMP synthase-like glutamine amidotransferase